jgi:hypothetical protein
MHSQEADEFIRFVVQEAALDARASSLVTETLVFSIDSLTQVSLFRKKNIVDYIFFI